MMRRWVAVDVVPGFPWRRWLPLMVTAGVALLLLAAASAWWMRRLSKEVAQRRQAEQRLLAVANSLPGVVFQYIASADGKLLQRYVSDAVDTFLGPGLRNVPSLFEAVALRAPAPQAARLRAARAECLATRQPFKQTAHYNHPLHGPRWLHCEAVARTLDGGRIAWTGYVVDVSSERALQAELVDAVQAKNLFVASASHELRAPLQAITLALARLGQGPLDEAQRLLWQMAQQASGTLVQLIDDVLDLAHYESGRLTLQPASVALAPLLQQIVEPHRLAAQARGLVLQLQLSPALPAQASLDALRLRQLLANLVGNAVKYTPAGQVLVSAVLDGETAASAADGATPVGNGWLRLTVQDTGVGIAPERQPLLFTPFSSAQALAGLPAGERSHGLGLAICKRLAEAMQGEISLRSQPGQGTEVVVRLPLLAPAATAIPPEPAAPAAADGPAGLVLLVDDDALSRLLLAELLRSAGYRVAEAADAAEALAQWRSQPVAAVISDRHMPGDDGPTLLQRIADEARAAGRAGAAGPHPVHRPSGRCRGAGRRPGAGEAGHAGRPAPGAAGGWRAPRRPGQRLNRAARRAGGRPQSPAMSLGEFDLIQKYFTRPTPQAVLGVGDDCALLQPTAGMQWAISSDMLVEGRHFLSTVRPERLGHKALAVNLSDLAACGAKPVAFTLALALPRVDEAFLAGLAQGLFDLADAHGIGLVGGDTTAGPLNLCITVFGEVPPGQALRRDGARAGDALWVSHPLHGGLGDARLALEAFRGHVSLDGADFEAVRTAMEQPQPRVALGLGLRGLATAAIDVSDGLVGDLGHVLRRSGVGAEMLLADLPIGPVLARQPRAAATAVLPGRR